jgi:hypothetical protein
LFGTVGSPPEHDLATYGAHRRLVAGKNVAIAQRRELLDGLDAPARTAFGPVGASGGAIDEPVRRVS